MLGTYPGVSLDTPVLWKGLDKQYIDTFKQAKVAGTSIHKVFNRTFLSVLFKLNVCQGSDAFVLKI